MSVKIIRKQVEGVTDEMLYEIGVKAREHITADIRRPKAELIAELRQAMESAHTGEIDHVEVNQRPNPDDGTSRDFFIEKMSHDTAVWLTNEDNFIVIEKANIIPLADALRELGMQLNGGDNGKKTD